MKRIFLSALIGVCCAISLSTSGQSTYSDGYVVLTNNDTLRGQIENKDWKVNPTVIRFKTSGATTPSEYNTLNSKAFYVSTLDEHYLSVTTVLDQSPSDPTKVTAENINHKEGKSFFARILVRGLISLYYTYDFKAHYLVQEDTGPVHELLMGHRLVSSRPATPSTIGRYENATVVQKNPLYKAQLTYLFDDCPEISKKAQQVSFALNRLKQIVVDYNTCKGVKAYVQKNEKGRNEIGIIAGLTMTTHKIRGLSVHLTRSKYDPDLSPAIGLFLNHIFPRKHGLYSWYNEILYKTIDVESEYFQQELYDVYYANVTDLSMIKVNSGVRFRFTKSKLRPFVQGGLTGSFLTKADFYTTITRYTQSGEFQDASQVTFGTRAFEFGFNLGAGIAVHKNVNIEIRAEKTEGYSNAIAQKPFVTNYYLMASYNFGKRKVQ
jgi:hypothetical protein